MNLYIPTALVLAVLASAEAGFPNYGTRQQFTDGNNPDEFLSTGNFYTHADHIDPETGEKTPVEIYFSAIDGVINRKVTVRNLKDSRPPSGTFYNDVFLVDPKTEALLTRKDEMGVYFEIDSEGFLMDRQTIDWGAIGASSWRRQDGAWRWSDGGPRERSQTARVAFWAQRLDDVIGNIRVNIHYNIVNGMVDPKQRAKIYRRNLRLLELDP
nr:PREDICTED: uncharacterized protein LOC109039995 [Bemisia tabaci]